MEEKAFNPKDLMQCNWQYMIRHKDVNCFKCGEKVFLKSNPEHIMIVDSVEQNAIRVIWRNKINGLQSYEFPIFGIIFVY